MNLYKKIFGVLLLCMITKVNAQQDPQFTQYMYNTMSVNPAYAGTQGFTAITALGRIQWVGLSGAPVTQTLSIDAPLSWKGIGLGLNIVNDKIGPTQETYADLNLSYRIRTSDRGNLSFGLKGGARFFNLNESVLNPNETLSESLSDLDNSIMPTVGAGMYYYTNKYFLGVAVPNLITTKHYNENKNELARERLHFFGIAGYVFDLTDNTKFKPAALIKVVGGSPVSTDLSANFLFNNKFTAGLAWRWDDSISALLGFRVNRSLRLGYAYDMTTSKYRVTNGGSHELMLQYNIHSQPTMLSPRFF